MCDRPPVKVKFVGGAKKQYDSFKDLSTAALDMYSPNWKNYARPKSYIFPPVYSYGRPEVSDHAIEDLKMKPQEREGFTAASKGNSSGSTSQKLDFLLETRKVKFITDLRVGDNAEHIVFDALESVSHLASFSPLVIINNLDLNRVKSYSDKIFQNQDKLLNGEYDFVIIGPKVGMVMIEVKSSNKSKAGSQLRSFDKVIDFLKKEYPTVPLPEGYMVRKLLIFVNSAKSSHKKQPRNDLGNQKNSELNDQAPKDVGKNVSLSVWDQDDIRNRTDHTSKPGFYTKFFDFFHETGYSISQAVYESFAPVFVGLASFLTFKNPSSSVLKFDLLKISDCASLTADSVRLRSQNPKSVSPMSELETINKNFNILLMPTPDQQRALAEPSPNRQFIIGVAGTGKTIVLQQKALEMLEEGKKVLILTAPSYKEELKKIFEINCSDRNISVEGLTVDLWSIYTEFSETILMRGHFLSSKLAKNGAKMDPILFIKNWLETDQFETNTHSFVTHSCDMFDGIIIDDACDQVDDFSEDKGDSDFNFFWRFGNLCAAVMFMAAFETCYPSKTLWIGLDLVLPPLGNGWILKNMQARSLHARMMNQLLSNARDRIPDYPFDTVVLNQIMRNSENIFNFAYTTDVLSQLIIRPTIGHKIVGRAVTNLSPISTRLNKDKCETMWIEVKKVLDQLQKDRIPPSFFCILVGGIYRDGRELLDTFERKFIECNIQITNTAHDLYESENGTSQFNSDGQPRATGDNESNESLFLDHWNNASSREWPIVIFCTITNESTWIDKLAIQRYRAYSRATVKLYEISIRYPSPNEASSRTKKSKDAETLTLYDTGPSTNWKTTLKRNNTVHSFDLVTRMPLSEPSAHRLYPWINDLIQDHGAVRRQNNLNKQSFCLTVPTRVSKLDGEFIVERFLKRGYRKSV